MTYLVSFGVWLLLILCVGLVFWIVLNRREP